MKVFCVEDEQNIRELVVYALSSSGFEAEGFESGEALRVRLTNEIPDLLLLDIMLPDEDGLSIAKTVRANKMTKDLPIIFLTARSSEFDKVKGLDLGADDYITKPFGVLELVSRVKAVLRRTAKQENSSVVKMCGSITVNPDRRIVLDGVRNVELTFKEFELLLTLISSIGIVFRRDMLMDRVWGTDFEGESRTVDMHIKTLRQKLGQSGEYIKTVRGVGYKLEE